MAFQPTPTNYVTLDLLLWQQQGSLLLSPKFQRRPVWSAAAKAYLIDTMLRGFPVPPLHIRLAEGGPSGATREVIDGQQRLRALFDFLEGNLRLGNSLDPRWRGKTYAQLSDELQGKIKMYKFHVFQYQDVADELVLEIFARINTYSVALNAQELRNGKYFGHFKQVVYGLALEYLTFWRTYRLFTEASIARMSEAELVSELLVMQLDGLQDKKNSLESFYAHLDDEWDSTRRWWVYRGSDKPAMWLTSKQSTDRFRRVMKEIVQSCGSVLKQSQFRRVPLFYTLYCAVYHRLYGVPGVKLPTPKRALRDSDRDRLKLAVTELSDLVAGRPSADDFTGWKRDFIAASARQTDNVGPRTARLKILWKQADLG